MSQLSTKPRAPKFQHANPTVELLVLAAPMIAMMISRMMMGFIDFVMVSWLGTDAQAAIGPAATFGFVLACLGMGVASAVQTFVSQADGRGEPEQAGPYTWQTLYVSLAMLALSIPVALTVEDWLTPIARWGTHTATVTRLEIEYLEIAVLLVGPATLCAGFQGFFNGIQRPRVALYAVLVSTFVNILGNCALIYGMFGFPAMGIAGAALATVIGWTVRALFLAGAMWLPEFNAIYNTRHSLGLCWKKLHGLFYVGAPTSVQWLIDIGAWMVFTVLVMPRFGTAALAAQNVATQFMHLSFMPAIGLGFALTSQVGFAIGEGRQEKAAERVRVAMWLTGTYMTVVGLVIMLGRTWLLDWFSDDVAVIRMGASIMIWVAVFQLFDAMAITHMSALRGAGDTRVPAVIMCCSSWVFQVAGAVLMAFYMPHWGVNGPWSMCTLYIVALGVFLTWRWRMGHWKDIKLFDGAAQPGQPVALAEAEAPDATATPGEPAVLCEEDIGGAVRAAGPIARDS